MLTVEKDLEKEDIEDVELGLLGDQVCLFHRSTRSIYTQSFMLIILHDIHSSITNNAPVLPISL
jgi:hypothetical protein